MIHEENAATVGGVIGDRIHVADDGSKPSNFSVKTVRTVFGTDGDQLDKFDWHTIICINQDIVRLVKPGMRARVSGMISTTRAKSAIIASRVELDSGEVWTKDEPRRRRST